MVRIMKSVVVLKNHTMDSVLSSAITLSFIVTLSFILDAGSVIPMRLSDRLLPSDLLAIGCISHFKIVLLSRYGIPF